MSHLPVIVGFGGISPAGRSSSHHGYRRLVLDALPAADARATMCNLAVLMGLLRRDGGVWRDAAGAPVELDGWLAANRESVLAGTLIRRLDTNLFDCTRVRQHLQATVQPAHGAVSFTLPARMLPSPLPQGWQVTDGPARHLVTVTADGALEALLPDYFESPVKCAGQLPTGFSPDSLYASRNHPRGLQMTVYAASDALRSLGIDWDAVMARVAPDQVGVYAGSSMSQLDYNGYGGMLQARLLGRKVTSKQLPLGFGEMPADFVNAYVLGSLGGTGANLGACASFHYNLLQGIRDIQNGTHRVVVVGGSEAPLVPEIIEGYATMGALADDSKLLALDAHRQVCEPDYRRACRPFGENVGFTLGESAQFVVLFDDALALELGANIHGAVNDVFVNADGYKKSISSPGAGNYITVAKAAAATRALIGEDGLRHRTFVQAHGTSTPQNRVTESALLDAVAAYFGIGAWPVTAVKAYLGHSLGCAGADQLMASLGVWKHGVIPGIVTTEEVAGDVSRQHLDILLRHREVGAEAMDAVLLNAKGFGGNNATASILSPAVTHRMIERKHGARALEAWRAANEAVAAASASYDERCTGEEVPPLYKFDYDVRDGADLVFSGEELKIRGYEQAIRLDLGSRYPDMSD